METNKVLKFIQVNIFKGRYLDKLLDFLKLENPDFISMQEVTSDGFNLYKDKNVNLFEILKSRLELNGVYHGDLKLKGAKNSSFGNAVFARYEIIKERVLVLNKFRSVSLDELDGRGAFEIRPRIPRHLLDATVDFNGRQIHILSWHGAWIAPPQDTTETLRQAKIVAKYLESINSPFILGCDMNAVTQSKTVGVINEVASNLMMNSGVLYTTNTKIHIIAPRGFLVDYVFTSQHFKLTKLTVPQITVSDHLPVIAELGFKP